MALLALSAFLACFGPVWRAARVDPMSALRHE
jgi:ABC-type lipoprotein release transport system permease subunit